MKVSTDLLGTKLWGSLALTGWGALSHQTRTGTWHPTVHPASEKLQRPLSRGCRNCLKAPVSRRTTAVPPAPQGWLQSEHLCPRCPFPQTPAEQIGPPFTLPMPGQGLQRQHNRCPATVTELIQNPALHQLLLGLYYPKPTRIAGNSKVKYHINCVFEGLHKRPTKARTFKALS